MIGIKSQVHGFSVPQAADKESGNDQQHERTGYLRDHQSTAKTMAAGPRRVAASALLQDTVQIRARGAECGPESHKNSGEKRGRERVGKNMPVETKIEPDGKAG